MRPEEIEEFIGGRTEEYDYLCEVARRLEPIVGNQLTLAEAIALIDTLSISTFECPDGFVISSMKMQETIGIREAIAIAASLMAAAEGVQDTLTDNYYVVQRRVELAASGAHITAKLHSSPMLRKL